jgi:Kef-type K+ transport system membrane component KefB
MPEIRSQFSRSPRPVQTVFFLNWDGRKYGTVGPVLTFLALIVGAFVAGAYLDRLVRRSGLVGVFVLTGGHFLLLGLVIGPDGLNLINAEILATGVPVLNLALGWLGLILGLQLEWRSLRFLVTPLWRMVLVQAGVTVTAILGGYLLLQHLTEPAEQGLIWPVALAFAAVAVMVSPLPLTYWLHRARLREHKIQELLAAIYLSEALGILLFQVVLSLESPFREGFLAGTNSLTLWCGAVCLGVLLGLLIHLFLLYRYSTNELVAVVVGLLFLTGGISAMLSLSPLFVNFVAGLVVANSSDRRESVLNVLAHMERPVFIILMVLAGASWVLPAKAMWSVLAVCFLWYFLVKWLAGVVGSGFAPWTVHNRWSFGLAGLPQGAMAVALALSFSRLYSPHASSFLLTLVIGFILLTGLTTGRLERLVLRREKLL